MTYTNFLRKKPRKSVFSKKNTMKFLIFYIFSRVINRFFVTLHGKCVTPFAHIINY